MVEPIEASTVDRDRLVVWVLGTFHAALLVTITVLLLYLAGGLASVLNSLSTIAGLALFAALWLSSVWFTRGALRGALGPGFALAIPVESLVGRGVIQGGRTGLAFLPVLALILGASAIVQSPASLLFFITVGGLFFATIGAVFAFVIGCLLGLVFALLDLLLLGAARALVD